MLRQRSRPYLFSNALAPPIVASTLAALDLIEQHPKLLVRLAENTQFWRDKITAAGLTVLPGEHAIVPVMIGDAAVAARMAEMLLERGIFVVGFSYPVVPLGQARIRTQVSAAHSFEDLEYAAIQFGEVWNELQN